MFSSPMGFSALRTVCHTPFLSLSPLPRTGSQVHPPPRASTHLYMEEELSLSWCLWRTELVDLMRF